MISGVFVGIYGPFIKCRDNQQVRKIGGTESLPTNL